MYLVCECLNVKVEVGLENILDLETLHLILNQEEKTHPYFNKDVYKMTTGKRRGISEAHPPLVKMEVVGSWNVCQCLICEVYTHGTNYVTGLATCSSVLKEEPGDLKMFGRDRNISYSKVFKVCFPKYLDVPDDFPSQLATGDSDSEHISNLSEQVNSFLELTEKQIRASPNIPVEKQLQAMEVLRRRVKCEQMFLHRLIFQSKKELEKNAMPTNTKTMSYEAEPCANEYPQSLIDLENLPGKDNNKSTTTVLQNLPLLTQEGLDSSQSGSPPVVRPKPLTQRSIDADGVFEMDEDLPVASTALSSSFPDELKEKEAEGDVGEEEEEDLEFDENLPSFRGQRQCTDIARSVPLDVPSWPSAMGPRERGVDAKRPKDPQEIAASMQELARSVRTSSVDVFGDLPRPNLSTKSGFLP